MASTALDLVTIGHALGALESTFLRGCTWEGATHDQHWFLKWRRQHKDQILMLSGLEALASTRASELNDFLSVRGLRPQFDPLGPGGVGAVSVLDMLVEWLVPAQAVTVRAAVPDRGLVDFPAFRIPDDGVAFYRVEGYDSPLVELFTQSGENLWLMMCDDPGDGFGVAMAASDILTRPRTYDETWSGVVVPKVELQIEPDLSWMLGITALTVNDRDYFEIAQAFQQFKLRMNEEGARAKVATGVALRLRSVPSPPPLRIDRPFIGFFTQQGLHAPIAAFRADFDSWGEPSGSLTDM